MNQDFELKLFSPSIEEWEKLGAEFLQLPTRDFVEAPSLENLHRGVQLIEKYVTLNTTDPIHQDNKDNPKKENNNSTVYIHCKAGRTRSATLVACYLIKVSIYKHLLTIIY